MVKKKIYLYDLIGIKSGMDYYLNSFKKLLNENGIECIIRSNYFSEGVVFFSNIFTGNKIIQILKLIRNLINFLRYSNKDTSIFLFYGTFIDLIFFLFFFRNNKVIIDLHETIILDNKSSFLEKIISYFFKHSRNRIIFHSDTIKHKVMSYGFVGDLIYVPHFKYSINKKHNSQNICHDVKNSIKSASVNYLFFGNLRESKGVIELLNLIKNYKVKNRLKNVNFIIAGQDIFNIIDDCQYSSLENVSLIKRHINHDELVYLFKNSNFILLPYKSISQSGVLEMAIFFEKQIITSDLEYFKNILNKHKSFGYNFNLNEQDKFNEVIKNSSFNSNCKISSDDLKKYYSSDEFDKFIKKIKI
jgi:hypothetical protein